MAFMGLKRLRCWVVGACLSVCVLAWGQLPPPALKASHAVGQQGHERGGKQHKADAAPPVKPLSVIGAVEPHAGIDEAANASAHQEKQEPANEGTKADWWMVWLTAFLLGVAGLQAWYFRVQLGHMKAALAHSATAASAAAQSVRSMEESDRRAHRAYICVERAGIEFPQDRCPVVTVVVKNSGQTPAYDVRYWINLQVHGYPLQADLPSPPAGFEMSSMVLAPGGELILPVDNGGPVCDESMRNLIGTDHITIYVYGEVTYRDAFDLRHSTRYRLMYGGDTPAKPDLLRPCPEGNEAT